MIKAEGSNPQLYSSTAITLYNCVNYCINYKDTKLISFKKINDGIC